MCAHKETLRTNVLLEDTRGFYTQGFPRQCVDAFAASACASFTAKQCVKDGGDDQMLCFIAYIKQNGQRIAGQRIIFVVIA